ncbi:MAG: hypothetical protein IJE75_02335 [Firmicutes bacterium]|nr:hypothetical protein [Bacillota bacterium]
MMKVKIKHFPIYISADILVPIAAFSFIGKAEVFLTALLFSFLHELSHLLTAKVLNYSPEKITVNMFGEVLHLKEVCILPEHEILIHISGPVFNLIIALIFFVLYDEGAIGWHGNTVIINSVLGLYNLLPFYPLDGGKIVFVYLKYFMDEYTALRLIFGFAKVFLIFNFILGIYLVQYNLLNCLISFLALNIFISIKREEASRWYKGSLKTKIEQESRRYD